MKKYYLIVAGIAILVVVTNMLLINTIQKKEINFYRDILFAHSENCGVDIEKSINTFESNINKIVFVDDVTETFNKQEVRELTLKRLEAFYSANSNLITNISIYDQNRNVLNLYQDKNDNFIVNTYNAQRQLKLEEKDKVIYRDSLYDFYLPIFKENQVFANIIITVDLKSYIQFHLDKYKYNGVLWHSIIDEKGKLINETDIETNLPIEMINNIEEGQKGFTHIYVVSKGEKIRYYTAYYPLNLLKQKMAIAFSINSNKIFKTITVYIIATALFSVMAASIVVFYFLRILVNKNKKEQDLSKRLNELILTLENLPIGLIVESGDRKIKTINKTARQMLFIKDNEDVSKLNISSRFMVARNYFNSDGQSGTAFDSNQFILYQQEGNEVIIYKKETGFIVNGEDIFIEAFIDATSIEKSRKYEAASNNAKSEFLAKMSHEIRTPMNGIIGMTDALDQENLTSSQKEYLQIVKKSADLLLSIIDDILDFTKIESGKMQLEEIPYKLSDEIKLCIDLFKPIIEEKKLILDVYIDKSVPNNIIGDPFRLRQVISNLLSNSVKFTHEGRIVISVSVDESYDGNLTLQFSVADTGVGIPKNRLESIFNSFTQADESTSRKYGGSGLGTTIAKQLVNLMHGEIWVESPSSISKNPKYPGAKFTFTIEVHTNEPLNKDFDFSNIKGLNELNALIVAKNEESKKRVISFFDLYGINHKFYKYQEEKLEKLNELLQDNIQKFHLIVLLDGANFNAVEVARFLKEKKTIGKFIVFEISSNHKPDNYILTKRAGIDYYFIHPFEQEEFIQCLYEKLPNMPKVNPVNEKNLKPDLNILVAEDNQINQKVAETIFGNLGYKIELAGDGKEVVEMVQKNHYDIIFMDLLMPEKDGIQATVDIRGLGIQIPVIAMTATEGKKGRDKAITSGMNDYIVKPVKSDDIRKVLLKWFS